MNDYISRQALLRDIEKYHLSDGKFQHWVEVQPSVEADVPDTAFGNMISRQAAIDAVRSYYDECDERDESIEERIAQLPSVDERTIITEYCRKRDLVLISMESFRILQAYYNSQNGMGGD